MSSAPISNAAHQPGWFATERKDPWYVSPLAIGALLLAFVVYSTAVGLIGGYHWLNGTGYLSPFYSPEIYGWGPHAIWQGAPGFWPEWLAKVLPFSSAFLILAVPAGFRLTCYYYRKAYYRSIWLDPVGCAVGEGRKTYWGENQLPLILWNAHRYFLYLAIIVGFILLYDGIKAFWFPVDAAGKQFLWTVGGKAVEGAAYVRTTLDPTHEAGWKFGIGLGSIILIINPLLIMGYTFGCHSLRHLVGGRKDRFGPTPCGQYKAWRFVTWLNEHHDKWAMGSLVWVGFTDLYVRLCAAGVWHDVMIYSPFAK